MAYGKRRRMTKRRSKRTFRKGTKTKKLNLARRPMRGGWRI